MAQPALQPDIDFYEWLSRQPMRKRAQPTQSAQPSPGDLLRMLRDNGGDDFLRESLMSSGSAPAASAATQAEFNAAAGAAQQAQFNAAATEAGGGLALPTGAAPGAFDIAGFGGAGNAYLPAAGAIGAYDVLTKDRGPVRGAVQGAASGAAMGSYFGAPGAAIGAGIGGTVGLVKGLTEHESTRDVTKRHTGQLMGRAPGDATYQAYVRGMRGQYDSAPPDPSKPFAGKYGSFDEYKAAGLQANDLAGVFGNIDTYGPEWASLSPQQREAVTQANINANNYHSKKGEVNVTDKAKALELFSQLKGNNFQMPAQAPAIKPLAAPVTAPAQSTSTKIPRITPTTPPQALKFRKV